MRTIPREVENYGHMKSIFCLSKLQIAVLIGTALGDGAIKKRGKFHRLHIKHGANQLFWAQYKRNVFSNISGMPVRVFNQKVGNKIYEFCEFVTLTHPEFSKYYQLFYPKGKKTITTQLINILQDPLSLAVWYMDDGCADNAGFCFNTQSFSLGEVEKLVKGLKLNFNLQTTTRKNKNGWIIYVPKVEVDHFLSLTFKHILPQFHYKTIPYSMRNL